MTRSKGPSDGVLLPLYSRPRKNVCTETGKQESMTNEPRHQADGHGQLQDAAERASPFAKPSSWAGASTMPANATWIPFTPDSPFVRPGSRPVLTALFLFVRMVECLLVFPLRPECALILGNGCERLCMSRPLLGSYAHQESI